MSIKSFDSFNESNKENKKDLRLLKEHQETDNYMFFGNLETMKRLVDKLLTMDQSQIDSILNEHDWASDHISVATENLEQVFDFLAGHNSPEGMEEEPLIGGPESSHTVHDNHMRNMTSQEEEEVKGGIMGFEDFK